MTKLIIDAGTSWSKILEISCKADFKSIILSVNKDFQQYQIQESKFFYDKDNKKFFGNLFLIPSTLAATLPVEFDNATGHMVKKRIKSGGYYENEVISLAYGAKKLVKNLKDATIVDIGSRDLKWVQFIDGKYKDLDWNSSCGSVTGATVDMLCKFYNVDPNKISIQTEKIPLVCGVFAMEKIMDDISKNTPADIAIAKYLHGIAYNTWKFAKKPQKMYLSGGFCSNNCFTETLKLYCDVVPLGRYVLLKGLF